LNVTIKEIKAKSILSKSGIYGVDYALNPYFGCMHGCVYCYARFTFISRGVDPNNWGRMVFPKVNAPKLLLREIKSKRRGTVLISSVTDPYQRIEEKYRLTRDVLEIFAKYKWPIVILTKSDLVLRDLDLLKTYQDIEVGLTVTIAEEQYCRIFEPRAPSYSRRINVLKTLVNKLGENKIYAFLGPLIPIIGERYIENIIADLHDVGDRRILFDKLNIKAKNWESINRALDQIGVNKRVFWVKTKSMSFWSYMKKKVSELVAKYGITVDFCY